MIIVFNCPSCGAILRMKEQYGGQRGRCPHCQGAITVPAIETDAGMDLLPLEGGSPQGGTTSGQPQISAPPAFSLGTKLPGAVQGPAAGSPAPSQPATSSFSLGSRLPSTSSSLAPAHAPSLGGDSNIGLAPLEDAPAKHAVVSAPTPVVPKKSPQPAAGDEDFSLAPLEGTEAAKAAAKQAPKPAEASDAKAPATPVEQPIIVVCAKCTAKMRVPPVAAGKTVTCPKCKNKQRVPDQTPTVREASKPATGDTVPIDDLGDSGTDLGAGMLGLLDDNAAASPATGATAGAALGAPKLGASKSSSGLFGLPPLAVYGGAGAVALGLALLLVFLLRGPSSPITTPPLAQSTVPSSPSASPSPAGTAAAPTANSGTTPAPSAAPTATAPTTSAPPVAAPSPGASQPTGRPGLDRLRQAMGGGAQQPPAEPSTATSSGAPTPGGSQVPGGTPAAPAAATADPSAWRQRVPVVRLQTDGRPQPGDPPAPATAREELQSLVGQVQVAQQQLVDNLRLMIDADSARRNAAAYAEATAQGFDLARQLRRGGGPPPPEAAPAGGGGGLAAAARRAAAAKAGGAGNDDPELIASIDGELARISQIAGAMPILEAELLARASREPAGALAAALIQRGVSVPGAAPK